MGGKSRAIWLKPHNTLLTVPPQLRQKAFYNAFHNTKASGATDSLVACLFLLGDFFWEFEFVGDNARYKTKRCAWPKHAMVEMHNELAGLHPKCTTNRLLDELEAALNSLE